MIEITQELELVDVTVTTPVGVFNGKIWNDLTVQELILYVFRKMEMKPGDYLELVGDHGVISNDTYVWELPYKYQQDLNYLELVATGTIV